MVEKEEKAKFSRDKTHCNIGVFGHLKHGKTTFTAAFTKFLNEKNGSRLYSLEQLDNHKNEKEKELTINSHAIEFNTEKRHFAYFDCPGHVNYIHNTIVNAYNLDLAILVVDAKEGIKEQTKEHLFVCRQAGIETVAVFISKADLIENDTEQLDLVELSVRELLTKTSFNGDNAFLIKGSAKKYYLGEEDQLISEGFEKLYNYLDEFSPKDYNLDLPFLLTIESVLTKKEQVVVLGKIIRGTVSAGEEVEVIGYSRKITKAEIIGIEMFHKILDKGQAGDYVGISLKGVEKKDLRRGMSLSKVGTFKANRNFKCDIYMLPNNDGGRTKPIFTGFTPKISLKTADGPVRVTVSEDDVKISPGDNANLKMCLGCPLPISTSERFLLRDARKTIGLGLITEFIEDVIDDDNKKPEKTKKVKNYK